MIHVPSVLSTPTLRLPSSLVPASALLFSILWIAGTADFLDASVCAKLTCYFSLALTLVKLLNCFRGNFSLFCLFWTDFSLKLKHLAFRLEWSVVKPVISQAALYKIYMSPKITFSAVF